jgi:hypothetical protein
MTVGLLVFVQEVIAAMTTDPVRILWRCPSRRTSTAR